MNYVEKLDRPLTNNEVDFNIDSLATRLKQVGAEDMSLILRRDLSRPLTSREMDNNFHQLDLITQRLMYGDGPYPTLDLMFAGAQLLDPRVEFSRASTATGTGPTGRIYTAAIDEPRFVYDPATGSAQGLLVEGQSTNLISLGWYGSARVNTIEMVDSPLPSINARKVIITGNSAYSFSDLTSGPNQLWTHSIYAKHLTGKFIRVGWYGGSGRAFEAISAWFDLEKGEITGTNGNVIDCGIDDAGHGWYRCWVSAETVRDGSMGNCVFFDRGTSVGHELIWGLPQVEEGSRPTSYIPTKGSQVTRASDDVIIPTGDWFNPNGGTFVVSWTHDRDSDDKVRSIFKVQKGIVSEQWRGMGVEYYGPRLVRISARDMDRGIQSVSGSSASVVDGTNTAAFRYSPDNFGYAVNGEVVADQTLTSPQKWEGFYKDLVTAFIGDGARLEGGFVNEGRSANKPIARITYYPRALSNAELEALTS